jgi:5-methylcytosine-specific restriction endonuclease McrA
MEAERDSYLARVPENVHRRRQAQHAIERMRDQIVARDGAICALCGEGVTAEERSIDHIMPVALGGSDDPENLQVAHRVCNSRKGARYAA